jgi:hypothetical protein
MVGQSRRMSNAPSHELNEIAEILAAGLLRLMVRKSSPNSLINRDNPLDFEGGAQRHVQRQDEDVGA